MGSDRYEALSKTTGITAKNRVLLLFRIAVYNDTWLSIAWEQCVLLCADCTSFAGYAAKKVQVLPLISKRLPKMKPLYGNNSGQRACREVTLAARSNVDQEAKVQLPMAQPI
jgi:hypothetical protein